MMKQVFTVLTMICLASGCATMKQSLILGAGSGIAAGATLGVMTNSSNVGEGALIGGAIGALIGMSTAYLIKNELDDRDSEVRKDTLFSLEKFGVSAVPHQGVSTPAISFPVVGEERIETHRQGNKVIEGHRVWILGDDSNIGYNEPGETSAADNGGKKRK